MSIKSTIANKINNLSGAQIMILFYLIFNVCDFVFGGLLIMLFKISIVKSEIISLIFLILSLSAHQVSNASNLYAIKEIQKMNKEDIITFNDWLSMKSEEKRGLNIAETNHAEKQTNINKLKTKFVYDELALVGRKNEIEAAFVFAILVQVCLILIEAYNSGW